MHVIMYVHTYVTTYMNSYVGMHYCGQKTNHQETIFHTTGVDCAVCMYAIDTHTHTHTHTHTQVHCKVADSTIKIPCLQSKSAI